MQWWWNFIKSCYARWCSIFQQTSAWPTKVRWDCWRTCLASTGSRMSFRNSWTRSCLSYLVAIFNLLCPETVWHRQFFVGPKVQIGFLGARCAPWLPNSNSSRITESSDLNIRIWNPFWTYIPFRNQLLLLRKDYGHVVSRKRLYILLVREELMMKAAKSNFAAFCEKICGQLQCEPDVRWLLATVFKPN